MRLLMVEDEARIAEIVGDALRRAGFAVDVLSRCSDARQSLAQVPYDAAILDLGLPDGDGIDLLEWLRAKNIGVPVLVLTARDTVDDRVRGLNAGGDDYLVKPFAMPEVIARIKALLRRPGGSMGRLLTAGNISFDTVERALCIQGAPVNLPRREAAILEHLMRRLGKVVPKTVLLEKIYAHDEEIESNAIPVHVHHLRRKLLETGSNCDIHTVRGVGYLLAEAKP